MAPLTMQFAADETAFCGTHHGRADTAGYAIVRTRFGEGKIADLATFAGAESFGDALEALRAARESAGEHEYARMDVIYTDGCRIIR